MKIFLCSRLIFQQNQILCRENISKLSNISTLSFLFLFLYSIFNLLYSLCKKRIFIKITYLLLIYYHFNISIKYFHLFFFSYFIFLMFYTKMYFIKTHLNVSILIKLYHQLIPSLNVFVYFCKFTKHHIDS